MALSYEDKQESLKKIILLLLNVSDKPIDLVHIQKELFLLTESFQKLRELFDFKSSNYGVYSDIANAVLDNNIGEVFESTPKGIILNEEGRRQAHETLNEMKDEQREKMMRTITTIRALYDPLNAEELEFLVYETYGYTEQSLVYEQMNKDRIRYAASLLRKGAISKKRYQELLGETVETCS